MKKSEKKEKELVNEKIKVIPKVKKIKKNITNGIGHRLDLEVLRVQENQHLMQLRLQQMRQLLKPKNMA